MIMSEQKNSLTRRNKMILETSVDGFCIVDLDGKLLEVNSSFCNITDYSKEELLKMKITDIEALETTEQIAQHIDKIMKQGYERFETKHRRKDGKIVDIEISAQFCDFDGDKFFFAFFRDITELKEIEKAIKESEERYKALFQGATEGMIVADTETKEFKYANPTICRMLGYTEKEMKTMSVKNIHPEENLEYVFSDFEAKARGEKTLSLGTPCLRKDRAIIYANINSTKVMMDGKDRVVGLFTDVTEQKRIEDELEKYREKVFKTQRYAYIGSMGAIVAHQVNQPLTKINVLLDRALDNAEDSSCSPVVRKDIKKSLAEVKNTVSMIRKFRQYYKDSALEALGKANLSAVADRIVSVLRQNARQAKMRISVKGLTKLPEVEVNEMALEQIFLIIIQNAIDAANGKKLYRVDITGKTADGEIELQFSDDCCGIAPENIDKMFEPFFSTKTEDKGMGLGLNIVQQILTNCGGQIRVESQLDSGTTFYVTLPISNTPGA